VPVGQGILIAQVAQGTSSLISGTTSALITAKYNTIALDGSFSAAQTVEAKGGGGKNIDKGTSGGYYDDTSSFGVSATISYSATGIGN
jgi:Flp pilus assembly protein TadG